LGNKDGSRYAGSEWKIPLGGLVVSSAIPSPCPGCINIPYWLSFLAMIAGPWYDSYGPLSFKKIHNIIPKWMIDIKTKDLGRSDGVACSMVDVFYVPGRLSDPFGWLADTDG